MRYDDLIDRKLITPSLADFLIEEKKRTISFRTSFFPSLTFNIGLLYTSLIQAYVLAKAIKKEVLLKNEGYSHKLFEQVYYTWVLGENRKENSRNTKLWVFSFLDMCADSNDAGILAKESTGIISVAKKAVAMANENRRSFSALITEEQFVEYLNALPLLRTTEIDWERNCFVFKDGEGEKNTYFIDCQPFLYFWNNSKNIQSRTHRADRYIITSLTKGNRLGVLYVNMLPLNSKDSEIKTKQISWQAAKNETIRMIFKTLEISTDWLSTEKYWCDFMFMQKLADITEKVLPRYWKMGNTAIEDDCVGGRLKELFSNERIKDDISKKYGKGRKLFVNQIDSVLFGLFINHGVFKTMCEVFTDTLSSVQKNSSREILFELFLDEFEKQEYIGSAEKARYLEEYRHEVENHKTALLSKVPFDDVESPRFKSRSVEIAAEWRACIILKAAGIHADNIFADKEAIYSIDDYYNMLKNRQTSLIDDVKQVLRLLIKIYGALMEDGAVCETNIGSSGVRINEEEFYSLMYKKEKEIESCGWEELFDRFLNIVRQSEGNIALKDILGRNCICDVKEIEKFKYDIFDLLEKEQQCEQSDENIPSDGKYIFISYSHEDAKLIQPFLDHWDSLNIKYYIDMERFDKGAPWKIEALDAIESPNCVMVAAFISENYLMSKNTSDELSKAKNVAEKRYENDEVMRKRFIYPFNLVDLVSKKRGDLWNYLKEYSQKNEEFNKLVHKDAEYSKYADLVCNVVANHDNYTSASDLNNKDKMSISDNQIIQMFSYKNEDEDNMHDIHYTPLELLVGKFYTFLKYGGTADKNVDNIDDRFHGKVSARPSAIPSLAHCIYPIVASMKETRIHRDSITMVGYEMVVENADLKGRTNYILTTRPLTDPDDYYCIPHEARVAEDCSWMAEPLLISHNKMKKK